MFSVVFVCVLGGFRYIFSTFFFSTFLFTTHSFFFLFHFFGFIFQFFHFLNLFPEVFSLFFTFFLSSPFLLFFPPFLSPVSKSWQRKNLSIGRRCNRPIPIQETPQKSGSVMNVSRCFWVFCAAGQQTEPAVSADPAACRHGLPFSVRASSFTKRRHRRRRWRPHRSPAWSRGIRRHLGNRKHRVPQWGGTSYCTGTALLLPAVHAGP